MEIRGSSRGFTESARNRGEKDESWPYKFLSLGREKL